MADREESRAAMLMHHGGARALVGAVAKMMDGCEPMVSDVAYDHMAVLLERAAHLARSAAMNCRRAEPETTEESDS